MLLELLQETAVAPTSSQQARQHLRALGLRPTRQRVEMFLLMHSLGATHFGASDMHQWLLKRGNPVALATVYNNLKEFVEAGLLRRVSFSSAQAIFDTNIKPHHHIIDSSGLIIDTDAVDYVLKKNFPNRYGQEIVCVEITITVRSPDLHGAGKADRNGDE